MNSKINIKLVVDISGKVDNYDKALVKSLVKESKKENDNIRLLLPGRGLLSFIPKRYKKSSHIVKRAFKTIEVLLNYVYLWLYLTLKNVSVIHLQWLPLLELKSWEIIFLHLIRSMSPKSKLILTIHNIYPHNMSEKAKVAYNARFRKASEYFDTFIVHTESSKRDVVREFGINEENIHIVYHGVFVPNNVEDINKNKNNTKVRILQFGGQSLYKGTDVLVDAILKLPGEIKSKIDVHIVGSIANALYSELKTKDKENFIQWEPRFLSDDELNEEISQSDILVLPYRAISQSGVLLLAIYFEKLIVTSDLPSFKETLYPYSDDMFFESENSDALAKLLIRHIDNQVDKAKLITDIKKLKLQYSWENAAKQTLGVYKYVVESKL